VKPRHEKVVFESAEGKGYTTFLPTYLSRHRSGGRYQDVELPLFPGYLFCRFNPADRLPLLKIPGVFHVIGIGKAPWPIDETEIEQLQTVVHSGLAAQPWPYLRAGERVRIEEGSLRNLEGILVNTKGIDRLVLSVHLLQRSVAVEIERRWVRPLVLSYVPSPGHAPIARAAG
jgi:transcription antitermination factor NusG